MLTGIGYINIEVIESESKYKSADIKDKIISKGVLGKRNKYKSTGRNKDINIEPKYKLKDAILSTDSLI